MMRYARDARPTDLALSENAQPRLAHILAPLPPLIVVLALWEMLALVVHWMRGIPFPGPWDTVVRLAALAGGRPVLDYSLYWHIADSLQRWGTGFALAALCGLAFGLLAGGVRWLERMTMPTVHVLQLIPGLAWVPVAILLFGVSEKATVFMIAITAFTPIAISVVAGVKRVDETYVRAARMMGTGPRTLFLRVLLPGALPHVISGLRIGLGNGWRVLVAAEMVVGTGTGLGYSIIQSRWTLDYASAFVCILVICVIGLVVERFVFAPLERRTVERWSLARAQ